ncbi:hypothetical protein C2S51_038088 [Perilla frutescens var. frutescens]|nr:hypothetical protein C2S51_038088 [Perilla frutescens var. frutescens]
MPWTQMVIDEAGSSSYMAAAATGNDEEIENRDRSGHNAPVLVHDRQLQGDDRRAIATYKEQINDVLYVHPTDHAAETHRHNEEGERLMQFLMGLHDCYEAIRNQILILDPLPSVNQAYSMVLQVEEQKDVSSHYPDDSEHNALYTNPKGFGNRTEGYRRRLTREEKQKLKCSHCGGNGHEKSDCFDLVGVPDWYRKFRTEKLRNRANFAEEEEPISNKEDIPLQQNDSMTEMNRIIQAEVAKYVGNYMMKNGHGSSTGSSANFVTADTKDDSQQSSMTHYAFGIMDNIHKSEWIIDSGASIHMCCNIKLMHTLRKLNEAQRIFLPDGSSVTADYAGEVKLTETIILKNVLFAPTFTHNLISVGELTKDIDGKVLFLPTHCLIQSHHQDQFLGIAQ